MSISDWIGTYQSSNPSLKIDYTPIHPKHIVYRSRLPKTIGEVPAEFKEEIQHELPETFVVTIPKGRAWSDCAVISPDDKLLADVSRVYAPTVEHPIFRKWKLRPTTYVDGTVVVLPVLSGDHNYFHWLFEVLPRLHLLKSSGVKVEDVDYFFTNECRYPFHWETLTSLGIPKDKVIQCTQRSHIKAKKLVVPSLIGDTPNMPSWTCDFLRKTFLSRDLSNDRRKRIYINRTDAKYRKILNETEVIDFLVKLGFESLTLSNMPVIEQAKLFSSAEIVLAPHGAGLANIVFCHPETKVIDILMPKHIYPCYWFISNHLMLDYYCLFGEVDTKRWVKENFNYQRDFYVDISKLSRTLELAGI